jgi:hypothetical protein
MDSRTRKRYLHDHAAWDQCPMTWDESIVGCREFAGFQPDARAAWLTGAPAARLIRAAARVLIANQGLGHQARPTWINLLPYWCACFLAPWPYDAKRAAREPLFLPVGFGQGARIDLFPDLMSQLGGPPYLAWWALPPTISLADVGAADDPRAAVSTAPPGEIEVLPGAGRLDAWEHEGHVSNRLEDRGLSERERAAWRVSALYRRFQANGGANLFEDPAVTHRAKVKPERGSEEAQATVRRFREGVSYGRLLWEEWTSVDVVDQREALQSAGYGPNAQPVITLRNQVVEKIRARLVRARLEPGRPPPRWHEAPPAD